MQRMIERYHKNAKGVHACKNDIEHRVSVSDLYIFTLIRVHFRELCGISLEFLGGWCYDA